MGPGHVTRNTPSPRAGYRVRPSAELRDAELNDTAVTAVAVHSPPIRRSLADDRGAGYLAAFIVLFSVLLVAGVGILVDMSRIFTADREVTSISMEAARAGANAIDAESIGNGGVAVHPGRAQSAAATAAANFVSHTDATLVSVSVSANRVTVTVSSGVDSWFPIVSGRTVSATSTAEANRLKQ
jgi:hypothetical protein